MRTPRMETCQLQFVTLEDIAAGLFTSHENDIDPGAQKCRSIIFGSPLCDEAQVINKKICRTKFGGKALNLAILCHHGFNVPPGFVITTDHFHAHMRTCLAENPGLSPREALTNLTFSPAFVEQLRLALEDIPASQWAVRSSSTDEDSKHHSFAGLQESVIGIDNVDDCLEAIRTVWQSFYARERLMYPSQASLSAPVPAMAVIIQAYIASESAGVVFTRHPIMGSPAMLVNVSHGQGANVVDGKAGEALHLNKDSQFSEIQSECLMPHQLKQLAQTALDIERVFECPQDIEFAFEDNRLFILQTRDIVNQDPKRVLYSNTNVGEALSDAATPMTWSVGMSIAKKGFETVFGMLGLSAPPSYTFVTTFYGHIYLNISQILSVASQVPFIQPEIFAHILGLQSVSDYAYTVEPLKRGHFLRHLPHSLAQLTRLQARIAKLPDRGADFRAERDALLALNLKQAKHAEIRTAFERLNTLFFDCAIDMLGAAGAFLASYVLCSRFVEHINPNDDIPLEQHFMSGLNDVQSAAPGFDLLKLANDIRQWPDLVQAFITSPLLNDTAAFKAEVSDIPGGKAFIASFDQFLQNHGLRANQEAELANPRWRDDPSFLLKVIRTHLKTNPQAPDGITASVSTHRESRTHAFSGMLSRTMRPIFRTLLETTQKNSRLREQWRAYVVDVLGIFRQFFLDIATQLVAQGLLHKPEDIFFLTYDEILSWLDNPDTLQNAPLWVAFRKARHEAYQTAHGLPDTFVTHPNQCSEEPLGTSSKLLYGLAASPGTVKARVRVARNLEEAAELEYGEILVASSTDVGWTPLFLVASAILTERGGPLSHAFVVAREYGLPAVVSIPGLMHTLKTGDIVTVCGDRGIVSI